jgi:hypothetical protein
VPVKYDRVTDEVILRSTNKDNIFLLHHSGSQAEYESLDKQFAIVGEMSRANEKSEHALAAIKSL